MFIVLPLGKDIVDATFGDRGPASDISQFREAQEKFSEKQKFRGDTGYKGEERIATPHKRSKKRKLTRQQKEENTEFAQKRIYVEHVIRLMKIFRVAQQRFRLASSQYKKVMRVICGLVRFRIGALILPSLFDEDLFSREISRYDFQENFSQLCSESSYPQPLLLETQF